MNGSNSPKHTTEGTSSSIQIEPKPANSDRSENEVSSFNGSLILSPEELGVNKIVALNIGEEGDSTRCLDSKKLSENEQALQKNNGLSEDSDRYSQIARYTLAMFHGISPLSVPLPLPLSPYYPDNIVHAFMFAPFNVAVGKMFYHVLHNRYPFAYVKEVGLGKLVGREVFSLGATFSIGTAIGAVLEKTTYQYKGPMAVPELNRGPAGALGIVTYFCFFALLNQLITKFPEEPRELIRNRKQTPTQFLGEYVQETVDRLVMRPFNAACMTKLIWDLALKLGKDEFPIMILPFLAVCCDQFLLLLHTIAYRKSTLALEKVIDVKLSITDYTETVEEAKEESDSDEESDQDNIRRAAPYDSQLDLFTSRHLCDAFNDSKPCLYGIRSIASFSTGVIAMLLINRTMDESKLSQFEMALFCLLAVQLSIITEKGFDLFYQSCYPVEEKRNHTFSFFKKVPYEPVTRPQLPGEDPETSTQTLHSGYRPTK